MRGKIVVQDEGQFLFARGDSFLTAHKTL